MKAIHLPIAAITLALLAGAAEAQLRDAQTIRGQTIDGVGEPPSDTVTLAAEIDTSMSFFVTSDAPGNGGDLGGLAGADALCQSLAESAGAGDHTWRAYLSQAPMGDMPHVDARDRIGAGPWYNAQGTLIAANIDDLHEDRNNIRKYTALNEHGEEVNGRGDSPNRHDILTGSDSMGRLFDADPAVATCNNWTSNSDDHTARLGHHDRLGGANASWNSVHTSAGCAQQSLVRTGGDGLLYCFATGE